MSDYPKPRKPQKGAHWREWENYEEDMDRWRRANRMSRRRGTSNWSAPAGGSDADGNPLTVSFGSGPSEGHTLLGDGDRSESNFLDSRNHDHYGRGDGPNNNGTNRGQYSGRGH